jgi:hypothetical protein
VLQYLRHTAYNDFKFATLIGPADMDFVKHVGAQRFKIEMKDPDYSPTPSHSTFEQKTTV